MITEHDLQAAIAECQGQRRPDASTCIKLAAYYTIRDAMFTGTKPERTAGYSYSTAPDTIQISSDTEFAAVVSGKTQDEVMPIIDELMTTLQIIHPRLYTAVLQKLR